MPKHVDWLITFVGKHFVLAVKANALVATEQVFVALKCTSVPYYLLWLVGLEDYYKVMLGIPKGLIA